MKRITNLIIEDGIDLERPRKTRHTVRGVVLDKTRILLIYSEMFGDYTFPGGGRKEDESHFETLAREMQEEVGAHELSNIEFYGYLDEIRYGLNNNGSVYHQTSHYYLCDVEVFGEKNLIEREKKQGMKAKWVEIEEAIAINQLAIGDENHQSDGLRTVLIREIAVLEKLLEDIKNEKI